MQMRKIEGPTRDPCGTPLSTHFGDRFPLTRTVFDLPEI